MPLETRREFTQHALQSLTALALIEGLGVRRLFGAETQPIVDRWFKELETISREIHDHRVKDLEFQKQLEALYQRVDLPALLKTLDFDRMAAGVTYPAHGAKSLPVDFKNVSGLSTSQVFGRQIFAMSQGRSVIPHGHDNMATGFLVLKGNLRGRHYDRLEDHKDHYIVRPTVDRTFTPGEYSTVSDHKDNVHWFTAASDHAFIFNIHVMETNPENPNKPGRVYVDPIGEKLAGGLIKAPKITYGKANQMYG
ncbi:cupin domain-containing protein [Singulisphaera acidiphila]|uniref:Cupin domain-containing protein n=1 Tax=Singulisphaera acidiphila (strain ATCC BAA-1392 / DSM 18658 / VKM B-2454 / MOB10) TaxID=886293 RepID=L0DE02_SINAD|nr:hypothetical protein [Singulisphaera acidiphila]AGA27477.1 Protein of unknown function (DUF1637) [Singulisphaera acidiphila DSM 18658]